MPWQECDRVSLRAGFVALAGAPGANLALLCRRFGISRGTGYKWLRRYREAGVAGLGDRSRRPASSPTRTAAAIEQRVLTVRQAQPCWGGRKIRGVLLAGGEGGLEPEQIPAASTITAILRRHGRLDAERTPVVAFKRFEADAPNRLWQMDFKGHFALDGRLGGDGVRCWPLTILDDHSRYSLAVSACANERAMTVRTRLEAVFQRYGLPDAIITDNGGPWGHANALTRLTQFSVWLMRLGIKPLHSRPRHPQTMGKLERLHRTLKAELIQGRRFHDFDDLQAGFERWRHDYNHHRPHEALGLKTPASRYAISRRTMPHDLPAPIFQEDDILRKVRPNGCIKFQGQEIQLATAFAGQPVALRPTPKDGRFHVWFANFRIAVIDCRTAIDDVPSVTHLLERL